MTSNLADSPELERRTWEFNSRCPDGACDARVISHVGKQKKIQWKALALFVSGKYRWSRQIKNAWECVIGSNTEPLSANYSYTLIPKKVKYVDGRWVVSRFEGSARGKGSSGCGFLPPIAERYLLRGKLDAG